MRSNWDEKIDRAREKIASIKVDAAATQIAYLPKSEAVAKLDAWLDAQDKKASRWPIEAQHFTRSDGTLSAVGDLDDSSAVRTLIRALRPQLRDFFVAQIESDYSTRNDKGMTQAVRDKRIEDLKEKLYEAELAEERIIVDAEAEGVFITRRPDVNPKVLVEVL